MTHPLTRPCFVATLVAVTLLSSSEAWAQTQGKGALAPPSLPRAPERPATPALTPDRGRATLKNAGEDYVLQPGDKLRVEVYKDPQLSQSVQVRPDGKITLPLVGDIAAMGLKPIDLRERLTTALRDYMNNPVVTVIVVEGTAPTAYIVGEVNHPGAVTLQGQMTVLQALAVAGGLKDFADAKNIRILRRGVAGPQTIPFNYKDAINGSGASAMFLEPGDTVVVPD